MRKCLQENRDFSAIREESRYNGALSREDARKLVLGLASGEIMSLEHHRLHQMYSAACNELDDIRSRQRALVVASQRQLFNNLEAQLKRVRDLCVGAAADDGTPTTVE